MAAKSGRNNNPSKRLRCVNAEPGSFEDNDLIMSDAYHLLDDVGGAVGRMAWF